MELSKKRSQTQERLIEAALEVFAKTGISGASVEQICETAGFTRGAFYSNFDSKDALLLAAYRQMTNNSSLATKRFLDEHPQLQFDQNLEPNKIPQLITAVLSMLMTQGLNEHAVLIRAEVRQLALRQPQLRTDITAIEAEVVQNFAQPLASILAKFGLKFSVPADTAIRWLTAVFDHEASQAILQGQPFIPESIPGLMALANWLIQPNLKTAFEDTSS